MAGGTRFGQPEAGLEPGYRAVARPGSGRPAGISRLAVRASGHFLQRRCPGSPAFALRELPSYKKLCAVTATFSFVVANSSHALALQIMHLLRFRQLHDGRRSAACHQVEEAGTTGGWNRTHDIHRARAALRLGT